MDGIMTGDAERIGDPSLYPEGEVSPGVPLCRMEKAGPAKERLCLIAKAGGFGPVGIISEIVQKLK